jgi:LuxR family maltose regulon positive regulatory protein
LALDDLLLDVKISVPHVRAGSVARSELIERVSSRVIRAAGVTAPAGYGKSTFLAQWAAAEERRVAWVSFDEVDDDPGAVLTLIASAYARIAPEHADAPAHVRGLGVSMLGRAAPHLASILSRSTVPFVLMLDDLHVLRSPACHDMLSMVIAGIPAGSQLVTASRHVQPHLPRLRAAGEAVEVLPADLTLDTAGAGQIFANSDIVITPQQASDVVDRTEGWPAGLQLAAMIARDSRGTAWTVSGSDRYVADYLYSQSMSHLDEPTQSFLRRTAVLDQLTGDLCDAVPGRPGSRGRLQLLEHSNSFIVPLDRQREWYRFHPLYREFLLGELGRVEPGAAAGLHTRAADWYLVHGSPATAVEHLLLTGDRERAVALVTGLVEPTYHAGQLATVQRWLTTLGDRAISEYPPLAVLAGWIAALGGEPTQAERWAGVAEAARHEGDMTDGTASFDSARAMLRAAMCPAGPEQMLRDVELALALEPTGSRWRDTALTLAGEACLLSGDPETASARFTESSLLGALMGARDTIVNSEAELAVVAMDAGRWEEARGHTGRALDIVEELRMYDYAVGVMAFVAAARLALHDADAASLDRELARAMRARPSCTYVLPFLAVRSRLNLARVYRARGDHATAHHLLREVDDVFHHRPELGVLGDEVATVRARLAGDAETVPAAGPPLSPAELRLLPYLQTHLTIGEIAERLFVSHNTVRTQVASIYRKLGVSSRSAAVTRATSIGLLGA